MTTSGQLASAGPWLRYRDTGLFVLPYRHYAMEFAVLPYLHGLDRFDKVCLELSARLSVERVRRAVSVVAPAAGAILISDSDPIPMRVPEYPGDRHPVIRPVFASSLLPITTDAMLSVLRLAGRDPARRPRIEFVDADLPDGLSVRDAEALAFPNVDAQEAVARGLSGWYARWEPVLRACAPTPSDAYREAFMALRLMESVLAPGCKALFVCGAMHWHRIAARLDEANPDELRRELARSVSTLPDPRPPPRQERTTNNRTDSRSPRLTFCTLDPSILYSLHMMDIPCIVQEFERRLVAGAPTVRRAEWIRQMVAACWERTRRPTSPRTLALMETFARRRQLSDARWSCDLDRHLLPSAMATAGKSFACELEQEAMRYGLRPSGSPPDGRVVPLPGHAILIFAGDEVHLIRLPPSNNPNPSGRRPMRIPQPDTLTDKEQGDVARRGLMMKPPCEERLHLHMCDMARRLGHDRLDFQRGYRPRPFNGHLGRGPEARRTIRAQACGDDTLYVKHPDRQPKRRDDCDECPVVWVFDCARPVEDRVTDFFADTSRGKSLLSSFFWFNERRRNGPVRASQIAWFVRLYRNVTPSWDKALVERRLIAPLPPGKFCTVRPWDDDELPFGRNDPDLAVACAVKWSVCDHIVVVRVDPAYQVGDGARTFARDRGIRILEPDPGSFDRILLTRYEMDHEVPTEGTWHPPDPIAVRLVAPVPGFDDPPAAQIRNTPSGGNGHEP